jgi:hypothetical protein
MFLALNLRKLDSKQRWAKEDVQRTRGAADAESLTFLPSTFCPLSLRPSTSDLTLPASGFSNGHATAAEFTLRRGH